MLAKITNGVKNGAAVYVGGFVARKFSGAVTGMLPAGTLSAGASGVLLRLVAAVGLGALGDRMTGGYAEMLTAGAFAETISAGLMLTPIAPYLGAMPARRFIRQPMPNQRRLGAYTRGPARQLSAYTTAAAGRGGRPVRAPARIT